MVKSCAAYGCTNKYDKDSKLSFHSFPLKNEQLCKRWVIAMKRDKWYPKNHDRLCSAHFLPTDYENANCYKPHLKNDAVPSIFNFPARLQNALKTRKLPLKRKSSDIEVIGDITPPPAKIKVFTVTQPMNLTSSPGKKKLKRKIKTLNQKIRRMNLKMKSMGDLIEELKQKQYFSNDVAQILDNSFSGMTKELILSEIKNHQHAPHGKRYSEEIKKFALTMHFYSPRAYEFLRSVLSLPSASSISNWTSSVQCEPGIFRDVFEHLKAKAESDESYRDCALMFDGVYIKSGILYNRSTGMSEGYANFGSHIVGFDEDKVAKEALVFMLVGLRGHWKFPVGYVLCDGISGVNLNTLCKNVITLASENSINIKSITCDGTVANLECMKLFGCKLGSNKESIDGKFKVTEYASELYFVPDVCHMLKLARNALADLKEIKDGQGHEIRWEFIKNLHYLQNDEGLKFSNKISAAHINFQRHKMNVKTAAQTLSSSVADSLEFLSKSGHPRFQGVDATVKFIRIIDRLFDLLNSKSPFGKNFKKPMFLSNKYHWTQVIDESIEYLSQLQTMNGIPLLQHRRKTFALGLITAASSIKHLSIQLLERPNNPFKYVLTYKFSQDHLELLFACIHGKNGFNTNPDCRQFKSALKKILLHNSISSTSRANCLMFDQCSVGSIFSLKWNRRNAPLSDDNQFEPFRDHEIEYYNQTLNQINFSCYKESILGYISGFIVRKMMKNISCQTCCDALQLKDYSNSTIDHDHMYYRYRKPTELSLIASKNRGGLIFPSLSVTSIVKTCEKFMHCFLLSKNPKMKKGIIVNTVNRSLDHHKLFQDLQLHDIENETLCEDLHSTQLTKFIIDKYVDIRMYSFVKKFNKDIVHRNQIGLRQQSTKLLTFKGL